jgi:hypothetical protein
VFKKRIKIILHGVNMDKIRYLLSALLVTLISTSVLYSYSPQGKDFGFGIMLGDPTGLTAKMWTQKDNAFAFNLGNSYLGNLRIGADYLCPV